MRDERAEPYVALVPETERFQSFHVIEPGGHAHSYGDAVVAVARTLRFTSWLGWLLGILHMQKLIGFVYAFVSRGRGSMGKLVRDAPGPIRWP